MTDFTLQWHDAKTTNPPENGDARKIVVCESVRDGTVWIGIRFYAHALGNWLGHGKELERVILWADLPPLPTEMMRRLLG